jgi:hypothetical protein
MHVFESKYLLIYCLFFYHCYGSRYPAPVDIA